MIRRLKHSALALSKNSGVSALIGRSAWRRERLLILCYHGISLRDEHKWNPELYMSQATFAARLDSLSRTGCHVLPLGEAIDRLYQRSLPDRAVALTFDDGYFDFKQQAYPLLRQHGFPGTVYLTTQRCDHNRPIVNLILPYVLWMKRDAVLDGRGLPGFEDALLPLQTVEQRARVCKRVDAHSKRLKLSPTAKDDIVRQISARLDVSYDQLADDRMLTVMNPQEVSEISASGVDVQLHTHRHRTPEEPELFVNEIRKNRERIEAMTGIRPVHFCYPSGVYRQSYLPLLAAEGVISATTCERGIGATDVNPLLMPRFVDTEDTSADEFEGLLLGAAEWLPRRKGAGAVDDTHIHSKPAPVSSDAVRLA
jgi:peptidoglycan/xylan/chitin deacetylase (PgdA/CDA1 family)